MKELRKAMSSPWLCSRRKAAGHTARAKHLMVVKVRNHAGGGHCL